MNFPIVSGMWMVLLFLFFPNMNPSSSLSLVSTIYICIQFIIEVENNDSLSFLVVLVSKHKNQILWRQKQSLQNPLQFLFLLMLTFNHPPQ